jgi:small subunit ribosomal protein S19
VSRSLKKGGYYVDNKLLEKIRKFSSLDSKEQDKKKIDDGDKLVESSANKLKKSLKKSKNLASGIFKTWARNSAVHPEMIGKTLFIHNGKEHKEVVITSGMVGLKLGALVQTRKKGIHGKAGKH